MEDLTFFLMAGFIGFVVVLILDTLFPNFWEKIHDELFDRRK